MSKYSESLEFTIIAHIRDTDFKKNFNKLLMMLYARVLFI